MRGGMMAGTRTGRLLWLDLARTAALAGMILFHFVRDLEDFGHVPAGLTMSGGWPWFARAVAGSFLFLSGVSLWFAASRGLDLPRFLRRLAMLAAAALAVSVATRLAVPQAWVFFGILHMMTAASVAGVLVYRLPAWAILSLAVAAALVAARVAHPAFDAPALTWLGLGTSTPRSIDFVPFFPWIAPYLGGLGLARLIWPSGAVAGPGTPPAWLDRIAFPGRHSLAVYLIHQPVLIAGLYLWSLVSG